MIICKLQQILNLNNIGQRELSRQTGIRQATISGYCNNNYKQIAKEHLDILCEFFNCNIEDLIEYIKED